MIVKHDLENQNASFTSQSSKASKASNHNSSFDSLRKEKNGLLRNTVKENKYFEVK